MTKLASHANGNANLRTIIKNELVLSAKQRTLGYIFEKSSTTKN